MDCRAAAAKSCTRTLTNHKSFSVAGRDTIAVTKPFSVAVSVADAWCDTVSVA
jgi:hypothetical protein